MSHHTKLWMMLKICEESFCFSFYFFDLLILVVCLTALRKRNTHHLNIVSALFKETEESIYKSV